MTESLFLLLQSAVATVAASVAAGVVGTVATDGLPAFNFAFTFSNRASKESSCCGAAGAALGNTYEW